MYRGVAMRMRRADWWIAAASMTVLRSHAGCALRAAPQPPPVGCESAPWLAPGPYRVASAQVVFHDHARGRTLASTLWWPAEAHGFLSNRAGGTYLARHRS
jgi:hypothetical protein